MLNHSYRSTLLALPVCLILAASLQAGIGVETQSLPVSTARNWALVSACSPGGDCREDPDLQHGVFTYYLIDAMKGKADSGRDGQLSILELMNHVTTKTRKFAKAKYDIDQTPTTYFRGSNFDLCALKPDAGKLSPSGTRWAIIIGVNEYHECRQMHDLNYSAFDARVLSNQFIANGFKKENVVLLCDGAKDEKYLPQKKNILQQMQGVCKQLESDDLVVFFYSGHGVSIDGRDYLCPADGDINPSTNIPLDELNKMLEHSRAGSVLVLIDAMHSNFKGGNSR